MPRHKKTGTEHTTVTLLRVLMEHNTAGWVVNTLADLQEELRNTDCADMLRSIVTERSGVPYVLSERDCIPGQRVTQASVITRQRF